MTAEANVYCIKDTIIVLICRVDSFLKVDLEIHVEFSLQRQVKFKTSSEAWKLKSRYYHDKLDPTRRLSNSIKNERIRKGICSMECSTEGCMLNSNSDPNKTLVQVEVVFTSSELENNVKSKSSKEIRS
ncbi:hypothetical protein H5410_008946 [Solanum commersonii]|uniref:Uncharacterized protein n=1 Tax=Solanum commersonii TaxID=4109 RepID=A0A9J6AGN0_SOLCO|nr:hypothetical protein H5410_008946 [Solanum commersonii]